MCFSDCLYVCVHNAMFFLYTLYGSIVIFVPSVAELYSSIGEPACAQRALEHTMEKNDSYFMVGYTSSRRACMC